MHLHNLEIGLHFHGLVLHKVIAIAKSIQNEEEGGHVAAVV